MSMKETLCSLLDTFVDGEVYLQGTLAANAEYPAKFITYFVSQSEFDGFFDNDANQINWEISVMFYSNNPNEVLTVPFEIIRTLKANGFIPLNAGDDLLSDVETHTGWALDFAYIEKYDANPEPEPEDEEEDDETETETNENNE